MSNFLLFFYFIIQYVFGEKSPVINTTQGPVRGLVAEDGDYYMYLGIPYAVVDPRNPFGASLAHPSFGEIFDAVDDSAICPQEEEFNSTITGTLDCLHLSVFVPILSDNTPKPVLVWIYGGGFQIGFYGRFLYGPKFLVRHDIIVISVNYRVGPYGFMCLDDPQVPGNQGLKDQLSALRWINENIANFGGDQNKVTLFGNSAGSMSIDYHIAANHERLFNQGILQSGTSFTPTSLPDKHAAFRLSRHFGLETSNMPTAVDFLANIDPLAIIEASHSLGLVFVPCIERVFDGVEAFISHNWIRNDTLPFAKDMSIIIGFNDNEGYSFSPNADISDNFVRDRLSTAFDVDHPRFDSEQLRHFFFGDEELNNEDADHLRGDISFVYPAFRSLDKYLKNRVQKVYLYKFSYNGGRNFLQHRLNITAEGATHADEVGYLFDISYMEEPNEEDHIMIEMMTEMWANFVKYGDPTPQISSILPQKWEEITPSSPYHYMNIDLQMTPGTRPWQERMTFWDLFFETYGDLQRFMLLEDGHSRQ